MQVVTYLCQPTAQEKSSFCLCAENIPVGLPYLATDESWPETKIRVRIRALVVQVEGGETGVRLVVPVAATDRHLTALPLIQ